MAQWADVPGYEGLYLVSDEGEIYSTPKMKKTNKGEYFQEGRKLKQCKRGERGIEYQLVKLCKDGTQKTMSVHRIVALAFVENPEGFNVVNHKDRDTLNNRVENLEWCDQQYNNEYSHNKRVEQWTKDGEKIAEYKSIRYASTLTGIHENAIANVIHKRALTAGGFVWKVSETEEE